jgi:GAF domain-containing protein
MKLAPIPADEADRIADLHTLDLLDTPREPRFDRITELAADVFEVPMVFVTLVDSDRQWFKSTCGLSGIDSTPRDVGFCAHAILEPEALVIPNAAEDPRFADNPFVTGDFHLRFYAGVPLRGPKGKTIGALCLVDTQPHVFSAQQLSRLRKFAALVEAEIQR